MSLEFVKQLQLQYKSKIAHRALSMFRAVPDLQNPFLTAWEKVGNNWGKMLPAQGCVKVILQLWVLKSYRLEM